MLNEINSKALKHLSVALYRREFILFELETFKTLDPIRPQPYFSECKESVWSCLLSLEVVDEDVHVVLFDPFRDDLFPTVNAMSIKMSGP